MAFETKEPPTTRHETGPRPDEGRMADDEFGSMLGQILTDCETFVDQELSPDRAKATDYYLGEPFGNEEEGRSQVVMTVTRDAVLGMLPSLMRVFFAPQHPVEYVARRAEGVSAAAQATDYVRYIFEEDNPGFLLTHAVLKDGLVRKLGIFKWAWDDASAVTAERVENVSEEQALLLMNDPDVTLTGVEDAGHAPPPPTPPLPPGQPAPPAPPPQPLYHLEFTRREGEGRARIFALPPEELLFTRSARDLESALCVAHRTRKTRGELIAMGYEAAVIDEHAGEPTKLTDNVENIARNPHTGVQQDPDGGEANEGILYIEAYPRVDYDGDGVAELRRVCTIGDGYHVVHNKPATERPFSIFCPDPEPHTLVGQSIFDRTADMQLLQSSLMRATLDSLAAAIFPRTAYVEGQVSVQDIMNTEIGAPIRQKAPGMVQPFVTPFVGKEALPLIDLTNDIVERRTGQNKGTQGLDADALQSSTKAAVGAAVTSSQMQTELLARLFAETCFKPLFKGLLRLVIAHQPRARMVRLRNAYVEVDPRTWDAGMDVTVNVALGSGLVEEKLAVLDAVAAKMEQIFGTMGMTNPICSLAQYRNVLAKGLELQGFKNTEEFFRPVDPNWQPPPPAQPAPDPNMALVQVEAQKAQAAAQAKQQELQIKVAELQARLMAEQQTTAEKLAMQREELTAKIANMAATVELQRLELELKYHAKINDTVLGAAQAAAQAQADMAVEGHKTMLEHERESAAIALQHQRESDAAEMQDARERDAAAQQAPSPAEGTGAEG